MNLTWDQYRRVADDLELEPAIVKAVAQVESPRGPWIQYRGERRPSILFEPHIFYRYSGSRPFSRTHPHLSRKTPLPPGGYGSFTRQWDLYEEAKREGAEVAAMMSCSWGAFQIMGFNHRAAGYDTVEAFVAAMWESEEHHLRAFGDFLRSNNLVSLLARRDWAAFARAYNGPAYAKNQYDVRLASAYQSAASSYAELDITPEPRLNIAAVMADLDSIMDRARRVKDQLARLQ